MIYHICDVMMSIRIWDRVHFWMYLFNHNSLSHQTWSIDELKNYVKIPVFHFFEKVI